MFLLVMLLLFSSGLGLGYVLTLFIGPLPWYGWITAAFTPLGVMILIGYITAPGKKDRRIRIPEPTTAPPDSYPVDLELIPDPMRPGEWLCPKCRGKIFSAVPGKTTPEEIIEFVRQSDIFKDNPDAQDGWIHPGIYCPKGCIQILADYSISPTVPFDADKYSLLLIDAGPRRIKVLTEIRKATGLDLKQAKELLDSPTPEIARGHLWEIEETMQRFKNLGADVRPEKIDS